MSIKAAIFGALVCLSVAGCASQSERDEGELVFGIRGNVGPIDPALSPGPEQLSIVHPVYENLVTIVVNPETSSDEYVGELARSWTVSDDRLEWTFALNSGHWFDDGSEVDADAVKFSIERLIAIGRAPSSALAGIVTDISVIDTRTVSIRLAKPVPSLLPLLAQRGTFIVNPAILQHEVAGDLGSQWLSTNSAGSGAFRVARYAPRDVYILERNPHFVGATGPFDTLVYRVASEPSVRALQLQRGDIDVAYFLPASLLPQFRADDRFVVEVTPSLALNNLALNMESKVFASLSARQAAAHAINYDAILTDLKDGLASPYPGPLLPGMVGYREGGWSIDYDLAKARSLLDASGLSAEDRAVELIYPGVSASADTMAVFLQSSLQSAGFTVTLQRLTVPAMIDRVQSGKYDAVLMGWVSEYGDPGNLMNFWFDPGKIGAAGNYARYNRPEVAALIASAASSGDEDQRAAIYANATELVNRDLPYIYLVKNAVWTVRSRDVEGLRSSPYDIFDQDYSAVRIAAQKGAVQ